MTLHIILTSLGSFFLSMILLFILRNKCLINNTFSIFLFGTSIISLIISLFCSILIRKLGIDILKPLYGNEALYDKTKDIVITFCGYFFVYSISFLIISYLLRLSTSIWKFLFDTRVYLVCGLLSIISFYIMLRYAAKSSLWFDDMCQISMASNINSFSDLIRSNLNGDNMPPLYHIITVLWLKIAPYGTEWLRLPSEIAVAIGIYVCGITGYRLKNERFGMLSCFICATSAKLIHGCAYAFRPYGFYFLFSAIVIYFYVLRLKLGTNSRKRNLLYSISLILMVYTHYFGILLCIALFICEFVQWLIKKPVYKINFIYAYIIAGLAFIPWCITIIPYAIKRISYFWPQIPTLNSIITSFHTLFGNYVQIGVLSILTILANVCYLMKSKRNSLHDEVYPFVSFIWCIFFVIGITFLYSVYISPTGSAYVDRYFYCLFPLCFYLIVWGLDNVIQVIKSLSRNTNKLFICFLTLSIFIQATNGYFTSITNYNQQQKWVQSAEWLVSKENVYDDNSLVMITTISSDATKGWNYYISHNNLREAFKYISTTKLQSIDLVGIDKIYVFETQDSISKEKQEMINNSFTLIEKHPDVQILVYEKK